MTARILVVDDDAAVLRSLTAAFRDAGYEPLGAATGTEAVRLWATEAPDLVVYDIGLPGTDGITFAMRVREEEAGARHVPIVLLTADPAVQEKVRALRAGADDVVVKPLLPEELIARARGLLARFAPAGGASGRQGRVSVFYGAKGGVGTTTLAVNAAIALQAEVGRRVVLVDGNLQFGDHHVFLDLGLDRKGIVDVVSAPSFDEELVRSVLFRHETGLDVLLGPPSPEMAELVRTEQLVQVVELLRGGADHVIVDVDRRLDEANLQLMDVADRIYLILTADLSCLKNVRLFLETIRHLGYEDSKVELILNRSTATTGIGAKNVEAALGRPIARQIVNDYRAAITALNRGTPFMVGGANGTLGRAVVDFAKSIDAGQATPRLLTPVAAG